MNNRNTIKTVDGIQNEDVVFSMPALSASLHFFRTEDEKGPFRDMHVHKEIEMIRVDSGHATCWIEDDTIGLYPDRILFVNSHVLHRIACADDKADLTFIQIDISNYANHLIPETGKYLYSFVNSNTIKPYSIFNKSTDIYRIFESIESEARGKTLCYEEYIKAEVYHLVAFMSRYNLYLNIDSIENRKTLLKIMPAVKYAEKHYKTKIYLEEVSKMMQMDKYYFCKLFKKATGATYVDYVNFVRLCHAEEYLKSSELAISEIAFECGFTSIQYFNRAFKKNNNCSPKNYRDSTP